MKRRRRRRQRRRARLSSSVVFGEMWALQRVPGEPLLPIEVEGREVKINIIACFLFRQLRYLESGMNPGP